MKVALQNLPLPVEKSDLKLGDLFVTTVSGPRRALCMRVEHSAVPYALVLQESPPYRERPLPRLVQFDAINHLIARVDGFALEVRSDDPAGLLSEPIDPLEPPHGTLVLGENCVGVIVRQGGLEVLVDLLSAQTVGVPRQALEFPRWTLLMRGQQGEEQVLFSVPATAVPRIDMG